MTNETGSASSVAHGLLRRHLSGWVESWNRLGMQAQFFGALVHRGRRKLFTAVGGAGRLRIYGNHIMPSGDQRVERAIVVVRCATL